MGKENNIKNRIGEKEVMKCGEECEIVEYLNNKNITIKFLKTGELVKSTYKTFKIGNIKSHFTPTVFGVGVVGLEKVIDKDGNLLKSYSTWKHMLERCYSESYQEKRPTYKNCKVCDEWLYYSNFKKWYEKNYYETDIESMCLDKDILVKGNKVYSPETCVFVPNNINILFTKSNNSRGNLPIGVSWHRAQKYRVICKIFNIKTNKSKQKHIGLYNTSQEAFDAYKKAKEENIKDVADYYKDRIPSRLYDAMYRYEVDIDD